MPRSLSGPLQICWKTQNVAEKDDNCDPPSSNITNDMIFQGYHKFWLLSFGMLTIRFPDWFKHWDVYGWNKSISLRYLGAIWVGLTKFLTSTVHAGMRDQKSCFAVHKVEENACASWLGCSSMRGIAVIKRHLGNNSECHFIAHLNIKSDNIGRGP